MSHTTHNTIVDSIWGIDEFLRYVYVCIKVPEIADEKRLMLDEKAAELDEKAEEAMRVEG